MAFEQHSDNLRRSSVKKLLEGEKVARNMKSCQKVAEQLVESPKGGCSYPFLSVVQRIVFQLSLETRARGEYVGGGRLNK